MIHHQKKKKNTQTQTQQNPVRPISDLSHSHSHTLPAILIYCYNQNTNPTRPMWVYCQINVLFIFFSSKTPRLRLVWLFWAWWRLRLVWFFIDPRRALRTNGPSIFLSWSTTNGPLIQGYFCTMRKHAPRLGHRWPKRALRQSIEIQHLQTPLMKNLKLKEREKHNGGSEILEVVWIEKFVSLESEKNERKNEEMEALCWRKNEEWRDEENRKKGN